MRNIPGDDPINWPWADGEGSVNWSSADEEDSMNGSCSDGEDAVNRSWDDDIVLDTKEPFLECRSSMAIIISAISTI